jgi:Fe-S cluster assembly ATP-binding protein
MDFQKLLREKLTLLKMHEDFADRYLNAGFSGGEKKKSEILQLALLDPQTAILDETDSGTDIDALRILASYIDLFANKDKTILIITHYNRILQYLKVDRVLIMKEGKIITSGDKELAHEIEKEGYEKYTE